MALYQIWFTTVDGDRCVHEVEAKDEAAAKARFIMEVDESVHIERCELAGSVEDLLEKL